MRLPATPIERWSICTSSSLEEKSVEAAVLPLQYEVLRTHTVSNVSLFDTGLFAKAYSLESGGRAIASNASSRQRSTQRWRRPRHLRTFRVPSLPVVCRSYWLGRGTYCYADSGSATVHIGMMAIPARRVQKSRGLRIANAMSCAITQSTGLSCFANRSCEFSMSRL